MRLTLVFAALLLVVAAAAEENFKCYVCDDCETGYEEKQQECLKPGGGDDGSGDGGSGNGGSGDGGSGDGGSGDGGSGDGSSGDGGSGDGGSGGDGSGDGGSGGDGSGNGGSGSDGSGDGGSGGDETESDGSEGDETENSLGSRGSKRNTLVTQSNELPSVIRIKKRSVVQSDGHSAKVSRGAMLKFMKQIRNDASNTVCVTAKYAVDGKTKVKRGCSFGELKNVERCLILTGGTAVEEANCNVCESSLCNSGHKLAIAVIPIIISIFVHF